MASYNTVPAEDTRLQEALQEAPKSWKLKKIVVVSAALSVKPELCFRFSRGGACRAQAYLAA